MKFKTFKQNKLVRDKIVEIMEQLGSKLYWIKLEDKEFIKQLKIKLVEEANEVTHANSKEAVLEEMADVLEVFQALAQAYNISSKEITAVQKKKRDEKGGFKNRTFLTFAEHPKDSPQERYCLADSTKYPEVKQ
ncbi:nucleoside triphosphate pyrophosphohydrolase [Candidatus Babeliales bacterium]|nr:nucleoside triphosphate pyrophosphohydrolase [Candidatus Babeliales bacterium]